MQLWIARHADTMPTATGGRDFDRPLSARGVADCARLGARLAALRPRVDLIVASDARRARTTAELLAPALGHRSDAVVLDHRIYDAEALTLLGLVRETPSDVDGLLLVGHNPGVSALVAHLARNEWRHGLPPLGIVCASMDPPWPSAGARCANVEQYLDPTTSD